MNTDASKSTSVSIQKLRLQMAIRPALFSHKAVEMAFIEDFLYLLGGEVLQGGNSCQGHGSCVTGQGRLGAQPLQGLLQNLGPAQPSEALMHHAHAHLGSGCITVVSKPSAQLPTCCSSISSMHELHPPQSHCGMPFNGLHHCNLLRLPSFGRVNSALLSSAHEQKPRTANIRCTRLQPHVSRFISTVLTTSEPQKCT